MEKLYNRLADILEESEVTGDTDLRECENMDSLSVLSIVSMVDEEYDVILGPDDLMSITTSDSLMAIIKSKQQASS